MAPIPSELPIDALLSIRFGLFLAVLDKPYGLLSIAPLVFVAESPKPLELRGFIGGSLLFVPPEGAAVAFAPPPIPSIFSPFF